MLSSCVRNVARLSARLLPMWLVSLLLAWTMVSSVQAAVTLPAPDVTTVSYHLVSKTRVSSLWTWSQYEYVYKIEVHNGGANALNRIVGKVSTDSPQIEIVDNEVLVGSLQPNQSLLSGDTFAIHSHKFFDRRLDSKIFQNGHWYFDDDNLDPDDQYVPTHDNGKPGQDLEVFYQHKLSKIFQWTFTYTPDAEPPAVSGTAPTGLLNQSRPLILATYSDAESGIDIGGVRLTIDGADVTGSATVSATGIQYQPVNALPDGLHSVQLNVADQGGNLATASWTFVTDTTAPSLSDFSPSDTALASGNPHISAHFNDDGASASGINVGTVKLSVGGIDVTASSQVTADAISFTPQQALASGATVIAVQVADLAGNVANSSWTIRVDAEPPQSVVSVPAAGAVLPADAKPVIEGAVTDNVAGILPGSITVQLDGAAIPVQLLSGNTFRYEVPEPLAEGSHEIVVTASDVVGNQSRIAQTFITRTAPVIRHTLPFNVTLASDRDFVLQVIYSDVGAGVAPESVHLHLDGIEITAASTVDGSTTVYRAPSPLSIGQHQASIVLADRAGNSASATWQFGVAPNISLGALTPQDVTLPYGAMPEIAAQILANGDRLDSSSVHFIVNGVDVIQSAQVTAEKISYVPVEALPSGTSNVYLEYRTTDGVLGTQSWSFRVAEQTTYELSILAPAGDQSVLDPKVHIVATAKSNRTFATGLSVNGVPMSLDIDDVGNITYTYDAILQGGDNTLVVAASFDDGATRSNELHLTYNAPPRVTITAPTDKLTLGAVNPNSPRDLTGSVERPFTVTGTVSKPVQSVTINQQQARLENGGITFRFDNFFLHEGVNLLTAVATDAQGQVGSAAVTVSVDQTAPIILLENPSSGAVTSNARIDVRGLANDVVEGFSGSPEPTVTITNAENGQVVQAEVVDRYFLAMSVPLVMGQNRLTVKATDQVGNVRTEDLLVSRVAVGSERLTLLSGNYQKGPAHTQLLKPLTVVALNAAGEPISGLPVSFDVTRGTGWISSVSGVVQRPDGVNPARNLVVQTDAHGYARVWLTPGKRSGVGAHTVRAWVNAAALIDGQPGKTVSEDVYFVASAERGLPAHVLAEMGTNQFAETQSQPLELLSAIVLDEFENAVPGVPVTFHIASGDAYFGAPGTKETIVTTDKNGYSAVRPTIGNQPGLVKVKASTKADPGNSASADLVGCTYLIQAREPVSGPASFQGYVYTDKGVALPGVRVSVGRTVLAATTDENGLFQIDNVPPGRIDLFVDGRTSNHLSQTWPALHFEVIAIRGIANRLPHPIYLPPLAMTEAKVVGGNEDVVLTIPGLEGFQMRVKANSVTFPDGSHEGMLVVSPVTADRLPMTPPGGAAEFSTSAWTIQPAGARFDPPIEVTIPNTKGMHPGETVPVVQWDHDLAQYVAMGHATVSEDGVYLVTDAGSGVTKAGWGGAAPNTGPVGCATPSPCDLAKCQVSDGTCGGCADSPNKCKDGPVYKLKWQLPPEIWANISQQQKNFGSTNPWVELEANITPSASFDLTVQDKCCADQRCDALPKRNGTVSGVVGANGALELKIGGALIRKLEDWVYKYGFREKGTVIGGLILQDVRPQIGVDFSKQSISAEGETENCKDSTCLNFAYNSEINMVGSFKPKFGAVAYLVYDPSFPVRDEKGDIDPRGKYKFAGLVAAGGVGVTANGFSISFKGKFGDACKDAPFERKFKYGDVIGDIQLKIDISFLSLGEASIDYDDSIVFVKAEEW